jgi:DNA-binding NarL/FixJ family response regulator
VYVVEDSMAICERIVRLVSEIDGTAVVGTAGNASSAIAGIASSAPHAVILDIRLANSSGFTVMDVIAQKVPRPKIIVLTNFNSEPYRKLAHERGADAFLDKSNDFLRIPEILRAWRQPPPDCACTTH